MRELELAGRFMDVGYDPGVPVFTAWDLGYTDDTSIWWYQHAGNEIHILDFYSVSGSSIEELAAVVSAKPYKYERHWLPHDAKAKTLASGGKSVMEQLAGKLGMSSLAIAPSLSVQDGIQAVRRMLPRCFFDEVKCREGIEALKVYQREYDEDKQAFRKTPMHNWASHPADALRMMAVSERRAEEAIAEPAPRRFMKGREFTLDDLWAEREEMLMQEVRI
jgi:hypothetical protein